MRVHLNSDNGKLIKGDNYFSALIYILRKHYSIESAVIEKRLTIDNSVIELKTSICNNIDL